MGAGPFGTGFAQSNFSFDPNISPNNQAFGQAVIAVVRRSGVGGTGGTGGGGTGSVTSVGLTEDGGTGLFTVSGSPVTTAGVINLALKTQSAKTVLAGPQSGAAAQPAFRTIALGTDLSDVTITAPAIRQPLQWDGTAHWVNGTNYQPLFQRGASFSGGANQIVIPTNNVAVYIPEDCNIIGVEVLTAGGTGSCVLDIWRVPYGSYPPTSGNSITASAKPTITGGVKYKDTTLTGWSTALSADDTLLVNLTSCSVFTYVMLVLTMQPVGSTTYNGYTNAQAIAAVAGQLAAPTNKVSGTATAGTSTFFMRADGAPALDWAQSPTWTGDHTFTPATGTAVTVNMVNGTSAVVVTVPAPSQGAVAAMVIKGTGTGGFYGLQLLSQGTFAAISISGTQGTLGSTDFALIQSGQNAAAFNGATGTLGLYTNGVLNLSMAGGGTVAVLGPGTAMGWGGGTQLMPALQMGVTGGLMGGASGNVYMMGGMFYNGTNYIFTGTNTNNSGTSTGIVLELAGNSGTLSVQSAANAGTSGGTANTFTVFDIAGTLTSNRIRGYGPNAAALVDMTPDSGTFTGTWGGFIAAPTNTAAYWSRVGNLVTVLVPYGTGSKAGAAGNITFGPIPTPIRTTKSQFLPIPIVISGGTGVVGGGQMQVVAAAGTYTFYNGPAQSPFAGTAAAAVGGGNSTWQAVSYLLGP